MYLKQLPEQNEELRAWEAAARPGWQYLACHSGLDELASRLGALAQQGQARAQIGTGPT